MPPNSQQSPQTPPQSPMGVYSAGPQPQTMQPVQPQGGQMTPQQQAQTPAQQPVRNPNSSQGSLHLSEIRDGMVIMADGSFRAVVACRSINFDLMSSREREGVEYSYQNFLNSLNHPIQILVRSQRIDLGPYIDRLIDMRRSEDNMLLGVLMDDYVNFIDALSQDANIMEKLFYIVIPYYPAGDLNNVKQQTKGFFNKVLAKPVVAVTKIDNIAYQKAKDEIKNRVDGVLAGLFQVGVQAVQLNTKELGELYYNYYNPDTAVREPLGNFENVTSMYVRKGSGDTMLESQREANDG